MCINVLVQRIVMIVAYVMYNRDTIGLIQIADIKKNNDYAMWLKVCQQADCYLLDEVLAKYGRGRAGSISTYGYSTMILAEKYKKTLADIATRDYGSDCGLSNNVKALDIDQVEDNCAGYNGKTIDCAIGIADYVKNHESNARVLLVELRLGYGKRGQNSKTSDMKSKETHTRELLIDSRMDERCFFIFSKDVAPQKRNRINRESMNDVALKKWVIVDPVDFNNYFHFVENMPYEPESPIETIRKEALEYVDACQYDKVLNILKYWLGMVCRYYNQFKIEECKAIVRVLTELENAMERQKPKLSEEGELDMLIYTEDVQHWQSLLAIGCKI